jgi:hypothetical protein
MGPEPKAGKRMKLDTKAQEIVIFDKDTKNFKKINYIPIDKKEGVGGTIPWWQGRSFP